MSQEEIKDLLVKKKILFASEILENIKIKNETDNVEYLRRTLKKMREHDKELGFILVSFQNITKLARKYPKIKHYLDKGRKITRPQYLYFLNK